MDVPKGSGGNNGIIGGGGGPAVPEPFCGDGILDPGEECDEGALNSNTRRNACREDCTLPVCGDGVRDLGEQCDDGNDDEFDGCTSTCTILLCGDGALDPGEDCDDGTSNSDTAADACRTNCKEAACGDGVLDAGEECDDGNREDNDGCSWDCKLQLCGNGVLDAGEECDDGADNSDGRANACRTNCTKSSCGDGVRDAGEECDDANDDPSDGCNACVAVFCGDGIVQGFEECDDGDMNSDVLDGVCRTDCTMARCGDGVLDEGEECDDGNADPRDGCAYCRFTFCGDGIIGYGEECDQGDRNSDELIDGCRTDCMVFHCGDGVMDSNETCDDGNREDGDGCSSDCRLEGDLCAAPLPVFTVGTSFEITADLSNWDADFETKACTPSTIATNDGVFSFRAPTAGRWLFGVRAEGTSFVPALSVLESCVETPVSGDFLGCDSGTLNSVMTQIDAGQEVFVVVDGVDSESQPSGGAFTLMGSLCGDGVAEGVEVCDDGNDDLNDGCTPECGEEAESCEEATPLRITEDFTFSHESDNTNRTKDHDIGPCGSGSWNNGGVESVYKIPPQPMDRRWTISQQTWTSTGSTWDAQLGVSFDCAYKPNIITCVDGGNPETLTVDVPANQVLYIYPSAYSSGKGPFRLSGTSTAL